jgi:hypothetical protein
MHSAKRSAKTRSPNSTAARFNGTLAGHHYQLTEEDSREGAVVELRPLTRLKSLTDIPLNKGALLFAFGGIVG